MPKKSVLVTIVAVALGFGIVISGCNRDSGRIASRPVDRCGVRPAEVLSASAYRPPARQTHYTADAYSMPVMAAAPGIRVVPIHQPLPPAREVYRPAQPVVVHPTPELAMARAAMPTPLPAPRYAAPAPTARQARPAPGFAPIPELEPARYVARAPQPRTNPPVMMTARHPDQDLVEVRRALEPLPQPIHSRPLPQQGWVSSPTTAMMY